MRSRRGSDIVCEQPGKPVKLEVGKSLLCHRRHVGVKRRSLDVGHPQKLDPTSLHLRPNYSERADIHLDASFGEIVDRLYSVPIGDLGQIQAGFLA